MIKVFIHILLVIVLYHNFLICYSDCIYVNLFGFSDSYVCLLIISYGYPYICVGFFIILLLVISLF
jgi:hypothetical protein